MNTNNSNTHKDNNFGNELLSAIIIGDVDFIYKNKPLISDYSLHFKRTSHPNDISEISLRNSVDMVSTCQPLKASIGFRSFLANGGDLDTYNDYFQIWHLDNTIFDNYKDGYSFISGIQFMSMMNCVISYNEFPELTQSEINEVLQKSIDRYPDPQSSHYFDSLLINCAQAPRANPETFAFLYQHFTDYFNGELSDKLAEEGAREGYTFTLTDEVLQVKNRIDSERRLQKELPSKPADKKAKKIKI